MSRLSKRVLLVKPDYRYFPVGFGLVVSALEKLGIEYDFVDTFTDPSFDLEGLLRRNSYVAVATGGLIGNYTFYKALFARVKDTSPHLPCILGGNVTVDLDSRILFQCTLVDYLVVGEGEITFPQLLMALDRGDDPAAVKGIRYRNHSDLANYFKTERRERLDLQSENWMPSFKYLDIDAYNLRGFPILTGRGCTGHCSFCSPTNGWFRARPMDFIFEEVEAVNAVLDKGWNFAFLNEILFPKDDEIVEFCRRYKELTPHRIWDCLLRADVSPDVLRVMKDAGCRAINVGIESGSDRVLKEIIKETDVESMRIFLKAARSSGLIIQGSWMAANYNERAEDIKMSVDFLLDVNIDGPMALTINYPGTRNYRQALKAGLVGDEEAYLISLEDVFGKNYAQVISGHRNGDLRYLNLSAMSDEELFRTVEWEMRRYNTAQKRMANVACHPVHGKDVLDVTGTCPLCDAPLKGTLPVKPISLSSSRVDCRSCGQQIYIPLTEIDAVAELAGRNAERLGAMQNFVIVGYLSEIEFFLRLNLFGIDYDKCVGILKCEGVPVGHHVINHRVLDVKDLFLMDADTLIVVVGEIPPKLAKTLYGTRFFMDRLVYLMPGAEQELVVTLAERLSQRENEYLRMLKLQARGEDGHSFSAPNGRDHLLETARLAAAAEATVAFRAINDPDATGPALLRARELAFTFALLLFSALKGGLDDEDGRFGMDMSRESQELCRLMNPDLSAEAFDHVLNQGLTLVGHLAEGQSEIFVGVMQIADLGIKLLVRGSIEGQPSAEQLRASFVKCAEVLRDHLTH